MNAAAPWQGQVLRGAAVSADPLVLTRRPHVPRASEHRETAFDWEAAVGRAREVGIVEGRALEAREHSEQWRALAESARAQAQQEGREQGREEGRLEALEQNEHEAGAARDRLRRLDALVSSAADAVLAWRGESEEDVVALAHEIACRVVGDSIAQPEHLRSMARHVIRAHGARKVLEVRVNPDDFEHVQASEGDGWEWIADPCVGAGVLLRLAQGGLDARVESQLRAMTDVLLAQRRARGGPRLREGTQE